MKFQGTAAFVCALAVAAPAAAAPLQLYPVQTGAEMARFRLGVPTLSAQAPGGAVQITPVAFDHGYVSLSVGVFNSDAVPANFGIENLTVSVQGQPIRIFTRQELDSKAKNRATWARVGTVLAYGLAAGAASTIHNSYSAHAYGPGYAVSAHYRDNTPGVLAAGMVAAEGGQAMDSIQGRLDYTLDHLATDIVQTTTVDPGAVYGGRIVLADQDGLKAPYDVRIVVSWNGQQYPFTFRVTHPGESVPAPFTGTPAPLIAMRPQQPVMLATAQPTGAVSAASYAPPVPASSGNAYADGRAAARAAMAAAGVSRN